MYRVAIMKKAGQNAGNNWLYPVKDNRFLAEPLCPGCSAALDRLMKKPADLMLVDLRHRPEEGLEVIRRLRVKGVGVEVIALVPRNNRAVMQRAFRLGVLECLTEAHDAQPLRQALERFLVRAQMMRSEGHLTQDDVDSILRGAGQEYSPLPKGLQETTLALVRKVLERSPESGLSCEDVSSAVGLSRITVQRYLAHLCEEGELFQRLNYHTGGRPSTLYVRQSEREKLRSAPMRLIV
jgi:response regulator of citrate/malate metabolism